MDVLQESKRRIEEVYERVEMLNSMAFVLWDSMVNGISEPDANLHGNLACLVSDETAAVKKELEEIKRLLEERKAVLCA